MKSGNMLVRNFFIFSLLLFGCLVGMWIYSEQASRDIQAADSWVTHTQTVIIETQGIMTAAHQMLSTQRGYLLTGDEEYRARFDLAEAAMRQRLQTVKNLARDNVSQMARLTALEQDAQAFSEELKESFSLPAVAPNAALQESVEEVAHLRDNIVNNGQQLLQQEYELLKARAAALEKKTRDYRNTIFIGGAGSALLLLLLNLFLLKAQSGRSMAERTLRETEDRLALAIRGSNNGVFDWDFINETLYWSPQYKQMLGYADHELRTDTKMFEDLLHPDDRDRVLNTYRQYINENLSEYSDIFRMRHKSGRWIWIQAKGMALFDEKSKATRFVGTHTDISHLKDYERRLEEEKDRAEKANAAKSEFLAHMSHEIRTPLTAISGIAEILMNLQEGLDEKQKKLIQTLSSSAVSLKDLIADILDFSKIESGEIELNERQFALANLFDQVLNITSVKAAEKQLDYTFDYSDLVEDTFYGDQVRLRQILINLIGNAIKFTDKGTVAVTAKKQVIDKTPVMIVEVRDTGIGISDEGLNIIFEKFRQADASVSRRYGGTGLGLPISRKLSELMNGTIKVDSTLDEGSVFTLYLPFKERELFASYVAQKPPEIAQQKKQDKLKDILEDRQKILIVEDYEGNIVVLSHILEEMGYDFDVARTGVEAINHWKANYYHLILMDVQMPEMDGLTATREIRHMEADQKVSPTPIVGLTAHALVADREKCIASGMNAYLPKPIDEAELRRTIERTIQKQPGKDSQAA